MKDFHNHHKPYHTWSKTFFLWSNKTTCIHLSANFTLYRVKIIVHLIKYFLKEKYMKMCNKGMYFVHKLVKKCL
jgi:hypothetical protein